VEHDKQAVNTIALKMSNLRLWILSQAIVFYLQNNKKLNGLNVGLGLDIAGVRDILQWRLDL